jgi:phenylpropionate dioxygenase-like ring-hydroxylating dioxygenase large terminal subunit
MSNYYGSIWATWDKKAPPFEEYLGPYAPSVRRCFQSSAGEDNGVELFNPVNKWRIPCNWKFPGFSFDGDGAHGAMTHRSINVAAIGPQGDAPEGGGNRGPMRNLFPSREYEMNIPALGHGGHNRIFDHPGVAPYRDTWFTVPGVDDYYRETNEKKAKKFENEYLHGGTCLVWPNVNIQPQRILVWHPHGVSVTESWRAYPVDRDAPKHVKDAQRRYMMRYGGPCGLTESDDMENWNYAHPASMGTIAQTLPYNFQMGLGHNQPDDRGLGMNLNNRTAEENQRARLNRWLDFMEAKSWDELYPFDKSKYDVPVEGQTENGGHIR